jgi:hypothetical protein
MCPSRVLTPSDSIFQKADYHRVSILGNTLFYALCVDDMGVCISSDLPGIYFSGLFRMITFLLAFVTMTVQSITGASWYLVVFVFAVIFVSAFGHLIAEHVIRFARGKRFLRSRPELVK